MDFTNKLIEIDKLSSLPPRPKNEPTAAVDTSARSLPLPHEKNRIIRPRHLPISPHPVYNLPSPNSSDSGQQLPSPASLKLMAAPISPELGNKSSSAPVIMKKVMQLKDLDKPEDETKKVNISGR